jgi:4-hydroxybenzoate polyprenyltransferase
MYVMYALWQLARPRTLIVIYLHAILFIAILSPNMPGIVPICAAALCLAAWYINAVAVNDISDEEVDLINLPVVNEDKDRPLINKTLTRHQLRYISYGAAGVFIISSLFVSWWLVPVALVMLVLNIIYSLPPARLSARGALAQLVLPLGYVVLPFAVALAMLGATPNPTLIITMLGCYAIFTGRLFLKDIRDEIGDRQTGKRTYIVRHGLAHTLIQSMVWITIGLVVMLVAVLRVSAVFYGIIPLVFIGVMYGMYHIFKSQHLDDQLLYVAIVGRSLSCWLFCVVLVFVIGTAGANLGQMYVIVTATIVMFLFGIITQIEELAANARKRTLHKRQAVR